MSDKPEPRIEKVLADHKLWLRDRGGSRADLSYANLSYANLSYANLSNADLSYANLSYANLSYANLSNTLLCGTYFDGALITCRGKLIRIRFEEVQE